MILLTAAFLSTIGFIALIVGNVFDFYGMAVIGGVLIIGVGAIGAAGGGYQTVSGTVEYTNEANETVTEKQYTPMDSTTNFSAGGLIMILGALGVLQSFNRASDL